MGKVLLLMAALFSCASRAADDPPFAIERKAMVERQIAARGVTDKEVLRAMRVVPRHEFVPRSMRYYAYDDNPLPIGHNQTISQPYIVAYMTEALQVKKRHKILEVGTGSGYQAAILAEMGAEVYTIEIVAPLGEAAKKKLEELGYKVHARIGDGYDGWKEAAPFDGIIVTAAPKKVPQPLIDQLKDGGRMVIPVGSLIQDLQVYTKKLDKLILLDTLPVRFVPMTGKAAGN